MENKGCSSGDKDKSDSVAPSDQVVNREEIGIDINGIRERGWVLDCLNREWIQIRARFTEWVASQTP